MDKLCIQLLKYMYNMLDLKSKVRFAQCNKFTYRLHNPNYKIWYNMYINKIRIYCDLDFIHYLIDHRKFVNWNWGLYCACEYGNIECAQLMINKGATQFDKALCYAYKGGNQKCIQLMIDKGANENDCEWGLDLACRINCIEYAQLMINKGATNFDGALIAACQFDSVECAQLMINRGATDFENAIEIACITDSIKCAQLLIKIGVKPKSYIVSLIHCNKSVNCLKYFTRLGLIKKSDIDRCKQSENKVLQFLQFIGKK